MSRSITGYLDMSSEAARFENELYTEPGRLYYAPSIGFGTQSMIESLHEYSPETLNTWLIDRAAKRSLAITGCTLSVENFKLNINYKLAGD